MNPKSGAVDARMAKSIAGQRRRIFLALADIDMAHHASSSMVSLSGIV
jgi:hypothetical protein